MDYFNTLSVYIIIKKYAPSTVIYFERVYFHQKLQFQYLNLLQH